jgi:hypothetical protein
MHLDMKQISITGIGAPLNLYVMTRYNHSNPPSRSLGPTDLIWFSAIILIIWVSLTISVPDS